MESDLLTIEQAAQESGRTVSGLYAAIRRGKLAREWREGDMVIRRSELKRYVEAARVGRPRKEMEGPHPIQQTEQDSSDHSENDTDPGTGHEA